MKAVFSLRTFLVLSFLLVSQSAFAFWFIVPDKSNAMLQLSNVEEGALDPTGFNVLVWNIYKGNNPSWKDDFLFLRQDKDILVLQEAIMSDLMFDVFEHDSDFEYHLATSFIYKKEYRRTGVATGSRVKPKKVYYEKTKKVEWIGLTPKALLFTEYDIKGVKEDLLVINIHALNSVPTWIFYSHLKQASDEIKRHKGPVIFAGDFNVWTRLKTKYMYKFMKKHGLKEVKFPNGEERMKAKITGKILDYFFIKGLNYRDSYVWGHIQGADHKAMEATLSVKGY